MPFRNFFVSFEWIFKHTMTFLIPDPQLVCRVQLGSAAFSAIIMPFSWIIVGILVLCTCPLRRIQSGSSVRPEANIQAQQSTHFAALKFLRVLLRFSLLGTLAWASEHRDSLWFSASQSSELIAGQTYRAASTYASLLVLLHTGRIFAAAFSIAVACFVLKGGIWHVGDTEFSGSATIAAAGIAGWFGSYLSLSVLSPVVDSLIVAVLCDLNELADINKQTNLDSVDYASISTKSPSVYQNGVVEMPIPMFQLLNVSGHDISKTPAGGIIPTDVLSWHGSPSPLSPIPSAPGLKEDVQLVNAENLPRRLLFSADLSEQQSEKDQNRLLGKDENAVTQESLILLDVSESSSWKSTQPPSLPASAVSSPRS